MLKKHDGTKCLVCGEKFEDPVRGSYCPKDIPVYIKWENVGYSGGRG